MSHPGYIVDFGDQCRFQVLNWLMSYLMDPEWQMSTNNTSCVKHGENGKKYYRWRMALHKKIHRVLFSDVEDVQLFVLAWGGEVMDLSTRDGILRSQRR